MHKHKQIVQKILFQFSFAIIMCIFIYSVHTYSRSMGLFNNVDIQISGNDYINTLLVESEIYPQINSSLLSINLPEIQNKLESMDYIAAVQVSRILPYTLMIHIVERSPMLLMNTTDKIIFMDKMGFLLPVDEKSVGTFPVPVLSILDDNGYMDDYTEDITQFLQFVLTEYPIFYKNLSEVKIQSDIWKFYSDNNTKIYTNASYLTNQLNILKNFEKTVNRVRDLQDYHYIDLRIKDQVIVKEKYRKG